QLTTDPAEVYADPRIDVVVEVMGGMEPTLTYVEASIAKGKHLVTANKEILSRHGARLLQLAEHHGVHVHFEGAVAGGIPVIHAMSQSLVANRVRSVLGILNGTTNYILTRMTYEEISFEEALAGAQALGYAEADPTADIEGFDAARKLAILGLMAFGTEVPEAMIHRQGISSVKADDIRHAREMGYRIKLLASGRDNPAGLEFGVYPALVSERHPLANVNGVFNAVLLNADPVGELLFLGQGAGGGATGSAVVADIINVARNMDYHARHRYPHFVVQDRKIGSPLEAESRFYVRFTIGGRLNVVSKIVDILTRLGIGLASLKQIPAGASSLDLVIVTDQVPQKNLYRAVRRIEIGVRGAEVANVIRIEERAEENELAGGN
ncbi:MAG: homoserine dehydrogenase, partial [Firmicutes bacterium]|nr:homoserine dehydrogenase [Bacillota bacterium]